MTSFPKGSIENPSISEDFPNITGSVPQMIQATMERFRNLIIREKVIKVPNQMDALRIFNYPYQAIEEAVVNAFYHRDYITEIDKMVTYEKRKKVNKCLLKHIYG